MQARRNNLLPSLLLALTLTPWAEAQKPEISTFDKGDALPSSEVFGLAQDSSGRLWVVSRNGITLYDGQSFTPAPRAGLPFGEMRDIEIDSFQTVWLVTWWHGPLVYRLRQGSSKWESLPLPAVDRTGHEATDLTVEIRDGQPRVALGFVSSGLWLWDGIAWSNRRRTDGLPSDMVLGLLFHEGGLAVATQAGLCFIEDGRNDCTRPSDPRLREPTLALFRDPRHPARLWIFSESWLGHLESERLTVVAEGLETPMQAAHSAGKLGLDASGGVYFGTSELLYFYDPLTRQLSTLGLREGLAGEGVSAIFLDRESNMWLGCGRGLSRIGGRRFLSFGREQGLLEDEVSAVLELSDGRLLLGHNQGLTFFEGGKPTRILRFERPHRGPRNSRRILDLAQEKDGTIWAAATQMGLLRISPDASWRAIGLEDRVYSVEIDSRDRLWVSGLDRLYLRQGASFQRIEHGQGRTRFIRWITASNDGRILASTSHGLLWNDGESGEGRWHKALGPTAGASNVFGVLEEASERWLVGTRVGLYELRKNELVKVDREGLRIDGPVYFLFRGPEGRSWFGTDDGVLLWDGESLQRRTVRHGLAGRETNRGAAVIDRSGRVWIGTDSGLSLYQPHYDLPPRQPPLVELLALEVAGENLSLHEAVELGYRDSSFTFHIKTLAMSREDDVEIRYRLEPFDRDWQRASSPRAQEIRYLNVPPGRYRFRIAAGWRQGSWGPELISPAIVLHRPYWRQPWFLVLTGLGAALLVLSLHALLTRAIRARNAELRSVNAELERYIAERQRLIGELEGQNAELERFTYTVSHDLKSPLVTIKGFLGLLKVDAGSNDPERLLQDIRYIEDAADKMAQLLDELLELSRIGRLLNEPETISMTDLAREAARLTEGPIRQAGATLEIRNDMPSMVGDRVRLLEVLQNLIENAVKYRREETEPRIIIGARDGVSPPVFFVRDNGIGIERRYQEKIFGLFERLDQGTEGTGVGLALVRRIIEVHGGRIWVESEGAGRGSTFCFTVPPPRKNRVKEKTPAG